MVPPPSDEPVLSLNDFENILGTITASGALAKKPKNPRHRLIRFQSRTEVHKILVALVKYTGLVSSEHCQYLFDKKQNKFDPSNMRATGTGPSVPRYPDLPIPKDYNWRKVLELTDDLDYNEVTRPGQLGVLCSNEKSNAVIKQARALAFFVKKLYLARGKDFINFKVEKMANTFVKLHWEEFFNTHRRTASKIRLVIDCEALGLPPDEFPPAVGKPLCVGTKKSNSVTSDNLDNAQTPQQDTLQFQLKADIAAATTSKSKSRSELQKEKIKFQKHEQENKRLKQDMEKLNQEMEKLKLEIENNDKEKNLSAKKIEAHEKLIMNANSRINHCTELLILEQNVTQSENPSSTTTPSSTVQQMKSVDKESQAQEINAEGRQSQKRKSMASEIAGSSECSTSSANTKEKRAKCLPVNDVKLFSDSDEVKNEPQDSMSDSDSDAEIIDVV